MAKQTVNLGVVPDGVGGDDVRTGFTKVNDNFTELYTTPTQAEAEAGTSQVVKGWTAQRVRQAITAWFTGISGAIGRTILSRGTAVEVRSDLGLGTAATMDVGTAVGQINPVGDVAYSCADIDDETQRGRWYVIHTTVGVTPTTYGIVNTYGVTGDSVNQEFVELVGGASTAVMRRFCRSKYGSNAWSPWVEYYHTGNLLNIGTTPDSARSALGLGTAAAANVGIGVGQVLSSSEASLMGAIASAQASVGTPGFWEITLPYHVNSAQMLSFQIKEYSNYNLSTIDVSGYLYSVADNWYIPTCTISGEIPPTVKFGKNAEGYAVIVVSTNQYSGVGIYNVVAGYISPANLHGTTITRHDTLPDHVYVDSSIVIVNTSANLQQTTGSSTNFPMSQAAVTSQLATKAPLSHTHPVSQITGLTGEWVDLRPYLKSGYYFDSARNGRNSYPRIRKLSCGRVELDGVVSFNETSGPTPVGVFVNVPAPFRPPLTAAGILFADTANPLSFGACNWLVTGEVEYSPPRVHGDVMIIPLTLPDTSQNGALSINGIYWFT